MRRVLRHGAVWRLGSSSWSLIAVGGIAYASIPDSNGVIHACYHVDGNGQINADGSIRLIDPGATAGKPNTTECRSNEKTLDWNAQGPAGATGPKGDTGATGPQGPAWRNRAKGRHRSDRAAGATGPTGDIGSEPGRRGLPGRPGSRVT